MTPLVLLGGGGHAKVVAALVARSSRFRLIGYTAPQPGGRPGGLLHLGDDTVLPDLLARGQLTGVALGIGIVALDDRRERLYRQLRTLGLDLPVLVSPAALVDDDVALEEGTVVMDGAIVHPNSRIGPCSIVNTHATVEHDCQIGAHCHIAPGAVLCGGVAVGRGSIVGAGARVLPGVTIGPGCLVGAGAVVTRSLTVPGTYVGCPARYCSD